jgi:hypothetical protein
MMTEREDLLGSEWFIKQITSWDTNRYIRMGFTQNKLKRKTALIYLGEGDIIFLGQGLAGPRPACQG